MRKHSSARPERARYGVDVLSERDAVIFVHRPANSRIVPIPARLVTILRRALQLAFGYAGHVASEIGIILQ